MSPPLDLTPVDKLEFLILVDNFVEWLSALPPGFTQELPQHILSKDVPIDPLTKLPIVDLDNYCCGAHGLSILIRTTIGDRIHTVLFDSGPEPHSVERNIKSMKVDLTTLDGIVLSHWHRDHSGGILRILEMREKQIRQSRSVPLSNSGEIDRVQVDLHPDRPIRRGISRPPEYIPICTLPPDPTFQEITDRHGQVQLNDQPHEMVDKLGNRMGVRVSGEIKRVTDFEVGLPGALTWMRDENGEEGWFNDHLIKDERYAVVDVKGHGLVVFSACSHAGICNVLHSLLPLNRPLHAIVGGLHLAPIQSQPAKETVQFISESVRPPPNYVLPLHCTGLEARAMLREKMGESVVPCGTGINVVRSGTDEDDEISDEKGGFRIVS
ncbi:hypothetical protein I302_102147 [Kwoniella bestiolae CBS 10118]|uniref:Metallo-beta-lactamase superfamily protein n=1 Tax=Kwoniella bestiolae CBS 10118 TaxID=1296100 RepID=A0A1B9GE86_9TREE|nr:metallo-beta-lactamase superfamily protein [Kwoniella bestiolae CBS 10118]OCF29334.1 metallo-beta-lactamase superfamily protein [Kwoniella bestiolae CBS 10118]